MVRQPIFLFLIGAVVCAVNLFAQAQSDWQSIGNCQSCYSQPTNVAVYEGDPSTFDGINDCHCPCEELSQLTTFFGIDGSKQPQDFGVNANLGVRAHLNYSTAISADSGIGIQIGTAVSTLANAVQVFELLGESRNRTQSFTTAGLFQRTATGFSWGVAYDYLHQESFDNFNLAQWRLKAGQEIGQTMEIGTTFNLSSRRDQGRFNDIDVELEPIEQMHVYIRKYWQSGANTAFWVGVADGHSEQNVVTGMLPAKSNQILFGADLFAPLNSRLALYGETNLMMPPDTGAVDAFLGIQFAPGGFARNIRSNRFRPLFSVAGNPTMTIDLNR